MKQPLKLVINVSASSSALNKQYPHNKRWQKVCAILISVRHGSSKKTRRIPFFLSCEKFFIYFHCWVTRTYFTKDERARQKPPNFHITLCCIMEKDFSRTLSAFVIEKPERKCLLTLINGSLANNELEICLHYWYVLLLFFFVCREKRKISRRFSHVVHPTSVLRQDF